MLASPRFHNIQRDVHLMPGKKVSQLKKPTMSILSHVLEPLKCILTITTLLLLNLFSLYLSDTSKNGLSIRKQMHIKNLEDSKWNKRKVLVQQRKLNKILHWISQSLILVS